MMPTAAQLLCNQATCKSTVPPPPQGVGEPWPLACPACRTALYPIDVLERIREHELLPEHGVLMRVGPEGLVHATAADVLGGGVPSLDESLSWRGGGHSDDPVATARAIMDELGIPGMSAQIAYDDGGFAELAPSVSSESLTLVVRSRRRENANKRAGSVHWELTAELDAYLAIDAGTAIEMISPARFEKWGMKPDVAWELALANVRMSSTDPFVELRAGLYQSRFGDSYDSNLVLLPELFRSLPVHGDPIAVVASASHVFVTGASDPHGLRTLAAHALRVWLTERRERDTPLRLRGDRWWPFWPGGGELDELRRAEEAD